MSPIEAKEYGLIDLVVGGDDKTLIVSGDPKGALYAAPSPQCRTRIEAAAAWRDRAGSHPALLQQRSVPPGAEPQPPAFLARSLARSDFLKTREAYIAWGNEDGDRGDRASRFLSTPRIPTTDVPAVKQG